MENWVLPSSFHMYFNVLLACDYVHLYPLRSLVLNLMFPLEHQPKTLALHSLVFEAITHFVILSVSFVIPTVAI